MMWCIQRTNIYLDERQCELLDRLASEEGVSRAELIWRLLDVLHVEDVNEVIARRAGELTRQYRRSHSAIGLADYLIAATAEVRGLELATLNTRHFPMFKGLRAPFKVD